MITAVSQMATEPAGTMAMEDQSQAKDETKIPSLLGGSGGFDTLAGVFPTGDGPAAMESTQDSTTGDENAPAVPKPKSLMHSLCNDDKALGGENNETMEQYCMRIGLVRPPGGGHGMMRGFPGYAQPHPAAVGMMGYYPKIAYPTYGRPQFGGGGAAPYWHHQFPQAHGMNPAVMESYYGAEGYGQFDGGESGLEQGAESMDHSIGEEPELDSAGLESSDASASKPPGNPPSLFAKTIPGPKPIPYWKQAYAAKMTEHAAIDQELAAFEDVDPLADDYTSPVTVPGMAKGKKAPAGVRPKSLISMIAGREENFRVSMNQELIEQQWPSGASAGAGSGGRKRAGILGGFGENCDVATGFTKPAPLFQGYGGFPQNYQTAAPQQYPSGGGQLQPASSEYQDFANDDYPKDHINQF